MGAMSLRLSDEVLERLNRLASATGRTKTYYATEAINRYLDDLEDLYLAETRWRELEEGRTETISLEDTADQYPLEDRD